MVKVEVRGNNRVANSLRSAATEYPKRVDGIVYQYAQKWRGDLKATPYPPMRSGQAYVRTGRLANSWGVTKSGEAKYSINNSAPYAKYVIDDIDQAWMHAGRWWTAQEILAEKDRRQALTRDLTEALTEILESGG